MGIKLKLGFTWPWSRKKPAHPDPILDDPNAVEEIAENLRRYVPRMTGDNDWAVFDKQKCIFVAGPYINRQSAERSARKRNAK